MVSTDHYVISDARRAAVPGHQYTPCKRHDHSKQLLRSIQRSNMASPEGFPPGFCPSQQSAVLGVLCTHSRLLSGLTQPKVNFSRKSRAPRVYFYPTTFSPVPGNSDKGANLELKLSFLELLKQTQVLSFMHKSDCKHRPSPKQRVLQAMLSLR
jgi:hypothetical protein